MCNITNVKMMFQRQAQAMFFGLVLLRAGRTLCVFLSLTRTHQCTSYTMRNFEENRYLFRNHSFMEQRFSRNCHGYHSDKNVTTFAITTMSDG